jgi:HEAT repeats
MEVAQLQSDLKSNDAAVRARAAEQLCHLEGGAQAAAVSLVEALGDSDESVREWANAALESLGPPDVKDVAALARLVANPQLDIAYWGATLLGRLGGNASSAVAALNVAVQSHPEIAVKQRAAWALGEIGPGAAAALAALKDAAKDSDPRLARLAREAIEKIESPS